MTRYDLLLSAYHHYDQIYAALILLACWVGGTGHLVDVLTTRRGRVALSIFWGLMVILFAAGVLLVGITIS